VHDKHGKLCTCPLLPCHFADTLLFSVIAGTSIASLNLSLLTNSVGFYQVSQPSGLLCSPFMSSLLTSGGTLLFPLWASYPASLLGPCAHSSHAASRALPPRTQISKLMIIPFVCFMEAFWMKRKFTLPIIASVMVVIAGVAIV